MFYKQMRYFNDNADFNQIEEDEQNSLINGSTIISGIAVHKIGIQTLPGTAFYLNGGNKCIVGSSGIWELDMGKNGQGIVINKLAFIPQSIENIKANDDAYLIIDMIYEPV